MLSPLFQKLQHQCQLSLCVLFISLHLLPGRHSSVILSAVNAFDLSQSETDTWLEPRSLDVGKTIRVATQDEFRGALEDQTVRSIVLTKSVQLDPNWGDKDNARDSTVYVDRNLTISGVTTDEGGDAIKEEIYIQMPMLRDLKPLIHIMPLNTIVYRDFTIIGLANPWGPDGSLVPGVVHNSSFPMVINLRWISDCGKLSPFLLMSIISPICTSISLEDSLLVYSNHAGDIVIQNARVSKSEWLAQSWQLHSISMACHLNEVKNKYAPAAYSTNCYCPYSGEDIQHSYRGTVRTTKTGRVCSIWGGGAAGGLSSQMPTQYHGHYLLPKDGNPHFKGKNVSEGYNPTLFPSLGLEANYCRQTPQLHEATEDSYPEVGGSPWCYVEGGANERCDEHDPLKCGWEECSVPECPPEECGLPAPPSPSPAPATPYMGQRSSSGADGNINEDFAIELDTNAATGSLSAPAPPSYHNTHGTPLSTIFISAIASLLLLVVLLGSYVMWQWRKSHSTKGPRFAEYTSQLSHQITRMSDLSDYPSETLQRILIEDPLYPGPRAGGGVTPNIASPQMERSPVLPMEEETHLSVAADFFLREAQLKAFQELTQAQLTQAHGRGELPPHHPHQHPHHHHHHHQQHGHHEAQPHRENHHPHLHPHPHEEAHHKHQQDGETHMQFPQGRTDGRLRDGGTSTPPDTHKSNNPTRHPTPPTLPPHCLLSNSMSATVPAKYVVNSEFNNSIVSIGSNIIPPMRGGHLERVPRVEQQPLEDISPGCAPPPTTFAWQSQAVEGEGNTETVLVSHNEAISLMDDICLLEERGRGSFGVVYRAIWNGAQVAVKVIKLATIEQKLHVIRNEIEVAKSMRHPNIIATFVNSSLQCLDQAVPTQFTNGVFDMIHCQALLVLEYAEGDLKHALETNLLLETPGNLNVDRVLSVLSDIAKALIYIHNMGIIHGDLKLENIMYTWQKQGILGLQQAKSTNQEEDKLQMCAKLADFGLAKVFVEQDEVQQRAAPAAGNPGGTLTHMAPECLVRNETSPASDIFAFGVVMWQLCAQSTAPYGNVKTAEGLNPRDDTEWMSSIVHMVVHLEKRLEFPANHHLGVGFEALTQRCWKQAPEDRIDAKALLVEIEVLRHNFRMQSLKTEESSLVKRLSPIKIQRMATDTPRTTVIEPTPVKVGQSA